MSYNLSVEDKTLELFQKIKKTSQKEILMKSALSKLTNAEAHALNLDNQVAMNRLFFNPTFDNQDRQLLQGLSNNGAVVEIHEHLKNLCEED